MEVLMYDLLMLSFLELCCYVPRAWHFTARFLTSHDILTKGRGIMYVSENIWIWTKWPGRLEKNTTLVENLNEIN